jgi:hypothetical protein
MAKSPWLSIRWYNPYKCPKTEVKVHLDILEGGYYNCIAYFILRRCPRCCFGPIPRRALLQKHTILEWLVIEPYAVCEDMQQRGFAR